MSGILGRNAGLEKGGLLEFLDPAELLEPVRECVNPDLLAVRHPGDLADAFCGCC